MADTFRYCMKCCKYHCMDVNVTTMKAEVTQHSKQAATGKKRKAETYFYQRTIHVSHAIDHNYTLFRHYFGELAATFHRRISGKFAISLICNPLFLSLDSSSSSTANRLAKRHGGPITCQYTTESRAKSQS